MFNRNTCQQTALRLVPVVFILLSFGFVDADEPTHFLYQRETVQSAEIDLLQAQLDLESWKQTQLEILHRDGFASWLETRRHQLTVDSIAARLEAAVKFQGFLSAVASNYNSSDFTDASLYQSRKSKPVKIFLPGSVRIIGWIEGLSLVDSAKEPAIESGIEASQAKLAKAEKKLEIVSKLPDAKETLRQSARLKLNLAKQELKHLEANQDFQIGAAATEATTILLEEIGHLVTVEANSELKSATQLVAKAEAAAQGHIRSTKILLAREQRRADAIADWQAQGHASKKEVKIVNERLAELNGQLNAYLRNQNIIAASLSSLGDSDILPSSNNGPVNDWPAEIFVDQQFVLHLVDLRRNYHKQQARAEMSRLKSEMLAEVLSRLQLAAANSQAKGQLESALTTGQQNEIGSCESDIEFANSNRLAAIEKQQIFILEEKRFCHQAVAMHETARSEMISTARQDFGLLAWSQLLNPTGAIAFTGSTRRLTHHNYFELGNLHRTFTRSRLVFCQGDLQFLGGPFSNSLGRYSLLPADTSLMTSYAGRRLHSPRRLDVEPQWMSYFRKHQSRDVVSTYDFPQLWRNPYHYRRRQPSGNDWPYPNSILRSELRGRITPGQVPWYLPGSPGNIRASQLKNRITPPQVPWYLSGSPGDIRASLLKY